MNLKKILALVLVLTMCLSFVPTYAFAEDDGIELVEEIEDIVEVVDEPEEEPEAEPEEEVIPVEPVEEETPEEEPAPVEEEPAEEPEEEDEDAAVEEDETFDALATTAEVNGKPFKFLNTNTVSGVTYAGAIDSLKSAGTIDLVGDEEYKAVFNKTFAITLNGNGHVISCPVTISNTNAVTIKGAKITGSITVSSGALTLDECEVTATITVAAGTSLTLKNSSTLPNTEITSYGSLIVAAGDTGSYGIVSGNGDGKVKGGYFTNIPADFVAPWYKADNNTGSVYDTEAVACATKDGETVYYDDADLAIVDNLSTASNLVTLRRLDTPFTFGVAIEDVNDKVQVEENGNEFSPADSTAPEGYFVDRAAVGTSTNCFQYSAKQYVAMVGTTGYPKFATAAVAAGNGGTVKLIQMPATSTDIATLTDLFNTLTVDISKLATTTITPANLFAKPANGQYIDTAKDKTGKLFTFTLKTYPVQILNSPEETATSTNFAKSFPDALAVATSSNYLKLYADQSYVATKSSLVSTATKFNVIENGKSFSFTIDNTKAGLENLAVKKTPVAATGTNLAYTKYEVIAAVAKVGTSLYATLSEAAKNANGATVVLLKDPDSNDKATLTAGGTLKIDFSTSGVTALDATTAKGLVKAEGLVVEAVIDGKLATITASEPVASIRTGTATNFYGSIKDASEAAGNNLATPSSISTIKVLKEGLTYTLGTAKIGTASNMNEVLKIDQTGKALTVKAANGYDLMTDINDANKVNTYKQVKIVAKVDGKNYYNVNDAVKAAGGKKPVELVDNLAASTTLYLKENETLIIGPKSKLNVSNGEYTNVVATPTGLFVTAEEVDGNVKFTAKKLVAEVEYFVNHKQYNEKFATFSEAATFVLTEPVKMKNVNEFETAKADDQAEVWLYATPSNTDVFTISNTQFLKVVATGTSLTTLTEDFIRAHVTSDSPMTVDVTPTNVAKINWNQGAVAYVANGKGEKAYFEDMTTAVRYAQDNNAAGKTDKFVVTVIKSNTTATPVYALEVGIATDTVLADKPFSFVLANGVTATLCTVDEATLAAKNAAADKTFIPSAGFVLEQDEDGTWSAVATAAAVNLGEIVTETQADFSEVEVYSTYNWTYFGDFEDAVEAAENGRRVVVVYADANYDIDEDETLRVIASPTSLEIKVRGIEDINNVHHKAGTKSKTKIGTATNLALSRVETIYESVPAYTVAFNLGYSPVKPATQTDLFKDQLVAEGELATQTNTPEREGYEFKQWSLNGKKFDFTTPITADTELVAEWTGNTINYTFTFLDKEKGTNTNVTVTITDLPGASIKDRVAEVNGLAKAGVPDDLVMLDGWYLGTATNAKKLAVPDVMGTEPIDYFAHYENAPVTITLQAINPETNAVAELGTITKAKGATVAKKDVDAYWKNTNAYTVTDWTRKTTSGTSVEVFGTATTTDLTATETWTAVLEPVGIELTFDAVDSNGRIIATAAIEVAYGTTKTNLEKAIKAESKISSMLAVVKNAGYSYDTDDMWSPALPSKVTGKATYNLKMFAAVTLTLVDKNKEIGTLDIKKGSTLAANKEAILKVIEKSNKVPSGKVFDKFTEDENMQINSDLVVHVNWKAQPENVVVTWKDEDGTVITQTNVPYGTAVKAIKDPTKKGNSLISYEFDCWLEEGDSAKKEWKPDANRRMMCGVDEYANGSLKKDATFIAKYKESDIDQTQISYSYTLSLDEAIAVNFYMDNIPADADISGYEVSWTVGGEAKGPEKISNRDTNTIVLGRCAAKEINDDIDITVSYKGAVIKSIKGLSINKYCTSAMAGPDAQLADLCEGLRVFGTAAQVRFNHNTENLAYPEYKNETKFSIDATDALCQATATEAAGGITGYGVSLNMISKTEMNIYLIHEAGAQFSDYKFTVKCGDKEYTDFVAVENGKYFVVTVKNISARGLTDEFQVLATKGDAVYRVKLTPLAYSRIMQNNASNGDIAKGIYLYGKAAKAYKT